MTCGCAFPRLPKRRTFPNLYFSTVFTQRACRIRPPCASCFQRVWCKVERKHDALTGTIRPRNLFLRQIGGPRMADAPVSADLKKLFCLLDLASPANIPYARDGHVDMSPLSNRRIVLNHAERRMAQLALLNLLIMNGATSVPKANLIWRFFQLHPARAITLGCQALLNKRRSNPA